MTGLLRVTMSEYSSTLNFSSGAGTSHAAWKNALENTAHKKYITEV